MTKPKQPGELSQSQMRLAERRDRIIRVLRRNEKIGKVETLASIARTARAHTGLVKKVATEEGLKHLIDTRRGRSFW